MEKDKVIEGPVHWWLLTFTGSGRMFSYYVCEKAQKVTVKTILEGRAGVLTAAKLPPDTECIIVGCFYLGFMSVEEFQRDTFAPAKN